MTIKLGFGTNGERPLDVVQKEIDEYFQLGDDAIELSLTKLKGILEFPFDKLYPMLKKFKYRSIHMPVITGDNPKNKVFLKYPDPLLDPYVEKIKRIASDLEINTFVVHPDQINDFGWANETFGNLLGFENMDNKKDFGKTIQDMQLVFEKSRQAKWIFDVNHLFTNDPEMKSAKEFFETFKSRLTHYHVSAFGGLHSSFTKNPQESIILKGVFDINIPMIHEGYKSEENYVKEEYINICNILEKFFDKNVKD